MEKFYLEIPSLERKEEALDYIKEFTNNNSEPHGTCGLNRCENGMPYEEWLDDTLNTMDEEYAKYLGRVPMTTYFMIREDDNKIVGMLNIRHYLNAVFMIIGGHIGGSIRPTERGKGYSKIQLYLALQECKKLGIDEAMIDCAKSNIKSDKAIQSIGGVLDNEFYYPIRKIVIRNYKINVEESLEKYKDINKKIVLKRKNY